MKRQDFSGLRVLVVGAKTPTIQLLRSVLGIAGVVNISHVETSRRALELLSIEHFNAVFCDQKLDLPEGEPFVAAARRNKSVLNPMIPIFMMQERARRRDVEAARDIGVTDVVTIPISPKTLVTKLQVATHTPRAFIVAPDFFGPDRRNKARPTYFGADRRKRTAKKTKVDFTNI